MTGQIRSKSIAMSPREIAHYSNDMVLMRNTIIEQTARAEKAEIALATARADALEEAALLVEQINSNWPPHIAAAIRALKDSGTKPA